MMRGIWLTPRLTLVVAGLLIGSAVAQDSVAPKSASVVAHMHEHLNRISAIKAFIIAGQLEDVREPAMWLAEHEEVEGLPGDWEPYAAEMRRYARQVASAEHLESAAVWVSEMARTCGECHQTNGVNIAFGYEERPPSDVQNVTTQMQRHLWASDRMWEGLIGPSDAAWDRGTAMLAEVMLQASDISGNPARHQRLDDLLKSSREIGEAGARTKALRSRTSLYGEFLSICASCHSLTGGGPRR